MGAHMAQEAANAPANNAMGGAGVNEEMKDDGGVRAPIQQQDDQLIADSPFQNMFNPAPRGFNPPPPGGHAPQQDPFLGQGGERPQMRLPRVRSPVPSDYRFTCDIPYDSPEDLAEARAQRHQAL